MAEDATVDYPAKHFATLSAVSGAFSGIMSLLLWIYLFGGIFIFGVQAEARSALAG